MNLADRLLDPETFEEALANLPYIPDFIASSAVADAIRKLHARLRTAKAEGAAEAGRLDWLANIGEFQQQLSASGDIHECQILLPEFEEAFGGYGPDWETAYRAAIDAARAGGTR